MSIEAKIKELGYVLPAPSTPKGNYVNAVRTGNYIYTAGHVPQDEHGALITGKIGLDLTPEDGYAASHRCALSLLSTLKNELGSLDRVARIIKLTGFVNCVDGFAGQPAVINGASDTFAKIFGPELGHARAALGTNALPANVCVEIEVIVELTE